MHELRAEPLRVRLHSCSPRRNYFPARRSSTCCRPARPTRAPRCYNYYAARVPSKPCSSATTTPTRANLNIHFHSLVLDGVYRIENGQPVFHPVASPTTAELAHLLERIVQRVLALLTRRGYWVEDHDTAYLQELNPDEALSPLQAAA